LRDIVYGSIRNKGRDSKKIDWLGFKAENIIWQGVLNLTKQAHMKRKAIKVEFMNFVLGFIIENYGKYKLIVNLVN
jgi:hypothetical protein